MSGATRVSPVTLCCLVFLSVLLGGCASAPPEGPPAAPLAVSFVDSAWNGSGVPEIGRCRRCGGGGMSPALRIENLPPGTTSVVIEFNDRSYEPMSRHGGHGAVRVMARNVSAVTLPSFRENTDRLPAGVVVVRPHRAVGYGKGVYLAPCSCGSNNYYEAVVKAVAVREGRETVLATGKIELGQF